MLKVLAAALSVLTAVITTGPATARTPAAAVATPQMSRQERQDHDRLMQANQDFQRRGYPGLARHLPALRQALDRMAADYGQVAEQDGQNVVRLTDPGDVVVMMIALSATAQKDGAAKGATALPNVYGDMALMLASDAVEARRYEEGVAYLDRVLKAQPKNWLLLVEKAAALQGLGRWDEALALSDAALADNDVLMILHRGPFHRRRGFSLIELGRLDEAKAAYEAALQIDADDANAKRELDYISQLKAGAPPTPPQVIAPLSPTSAPPTR